MDLKASEKIVIGLAREAGEIAKKYFRQKTLESHSKGGSDFVTKADLEVDAFLRERLQKEFPDIPFLTEETAPKDYAEMKPKGYLWVIDPIDGTTNFSRGDNHYAISIALTKDAKPVLGVVYLPSEERMYHGTVDESEAYCNDEPLHVSTISDLKYASVACDWAWAPEERLKLLSWLPPIVTAVRQSRALGSAASDLAKLAIGEIDGYVITGIKPWDIAAASLLLEKAGGKISTIDGSEWNIFKTAFVASNGLVHDQLRSLIPV